MPLALLRLGRLLVRLLLIGLLLAEGGRSVAAKSVPDVKPVAVPAPEAEDSDTPEVTSLAAYNVKADRIEDFGLRVTHWTYSDKRPNVLTVWFTTFAPKITGVVPNTAAAKAGLQPGEIILKSEGRSTVGGLFSTGKFGHWHKTQKKKSEEVAAGKKSVTWTLEVESPVTKAVRTVKLVVPTPPPQWGASVWRAPEGRRPSIVAEPGPLAERSRAVLDNGIWMIVGRPVLETAFSQSMPSDAPPPTGYEWLLGGGKEARHRIFVTQFRGRTDVILETFSPFTEYCIYLTSPSGKLERAWRWGRGKTVEMAPEEAHIGFEHEVDLWATKVGKVSPRWPFEVKPGYDPDAIFATLAPKETLAKAPAPVRPLAPDFLKLRIATEAERALFTDAYAKLGADADRWAYTETAQGPEDARVRVARFDPSQPEATRCVLLSIDGHAPTLAEVQQWRDDGGDTPKPLGDLPPLARVVDLKELRVLQEDATAVVFEAAPRVDNGDFPAEKFQALFRVNRARRGFEEITVKLRESFRVAGVVKVTDAGLELHFQTPDLVLAPQPVKLKAGGGVRVLLVKVARAFEATRTEFKRVVPFEETGAPE